MENKWLDEILEAIAKEFLQIETLEIRWSDSLDFHDICVTQIKEALNAAYMLGNGNGAKYQRITHTKTQRRLLK